VRYLAQEPAAARAHAAMSTPAPLNQETLEMLRSLEADEPGSLARLIRLFVADSPTLLSRVELAHERRDAEELRNAAHYLRSAALALGAEGLAAAAHKVEHLAPANFGTPEAHALLSGVRSGLRDAVMSLLEVTSEL
jgi:HPt (histidine-containing phosphotransfer) domain-containing protein